MVCIVQFKFANSFKYLNSSLFGPISSQKIFTGLCHSAFLIYPFPPWHTVYIIASQLIESLLFLLCCLQSGFLVRILYTVYFLKSIYLFLLIPVMLVSCNSFMPWWIVSRAVVTKYGTFLSRNGCYLLRAFDSVWYLFTLFLVELYLFFAVM